MFDPYELLGALQIRRVSFVVIGGFARVVHGTRELTNGIDITSSMRDDNLAALEMALEDLDARRSDGKPTDLHDLEGPLVELETLAGELRLVREPAGTSGYDDLRRRAEREPLGRGLRPRVASTDDLARMLGSLEREQNAERLLWLRRLMSLERSLRRELARGISTEH